MEFPEKLFLRRETVGIYMYFPHEIYWISLIWTHFFEKIVCHFSVFVDPAESALRESENGMLLISLL